jgi:hypothetical protein
VTFNDARFTARLLRSFVRGLGEQFAHAEVTVRVPDASREVEITYRVGVDEAELKAGDRTLTVPGGRL